MSAASPDIDRIAGALHGKFGRGQVLVVGDLMLDRYLWGTVERISPEAPTPVVRERRQSVRAGGAANVALNLAGLGLQVSVAGFAGNDESRNRLFEILARNDVDTSAVITLANHKTTTKTRVIAGHQHALRLDEEDLSGVTDRDREALSDAVLAALGVQAIILSDYGNDAVSTNLCQRVIEAARQSSTPVFVKPKGAEVAKFAGASVMTTNLSELVLASGIAVANADDLARAAKSLVESLGLKFLVVTQGADGMTLVTPDATLHSQVRSQEVFDVSGAGDTVIASIAAASLGELDYAEMLHLGNLAAGVVVGRVGTVPIEQASLLRALHDEERTTAEVLRGVDELMPLAEAWRSNGLKIVYTQDIFDGVRAADVHHLQRAAREGDKLVVGICDDEAAGDDQLDRASVIATLTPVDAVVLCDAGNSAELVDILQPEVLIKERVKT